MPQYLKQYKTVIVGLGAIGLGFDANHGKDYVLTHTKAFMTHPGFDIIYGFDVNPEARKQYQSFTGRSAYGNFEDFDFNIKIDVVVIAVPLNEREKIIDKSLALEPTLVVLEKPIAETCSVASRIIEKFRLSNVELLVNYMRRFDPAILKFKRHISEGYFGGARAAQVYYCRGILNNASHFIDLLIFLLGKPTSWHVIKNRICESRIRDRNLQEFDFWIAFDECRCFFHSVTQSDFSIGKLEVIFEKGIFRYDDFGRDVDFRKIEDDPHYYGYKHVMKKRTVIGSDLEHGQYHTAEHAYNYLKDGQTILSTGKSGMESLMICEDLINNAGS